MRGVFAWLWLVALGATGCTASAVAGLGGAAGTGTSADTTSADAGSSVVATTASTGCTPSCVDRRCGDDGCGGLCQGRDALATWRVDFSPGAAQKLLVWPETQSVFVALEQSRVLRVDTCDGAVLADQTLGAGADILSLARDGDDLLVVHRDDDAQFLTRVDARTLALGAPGIAIAERDLAPGIAQPAALLHPTSRGDVARVAFDGTTCIADNPEGQEAARSVATDAAGAVVGLVYWNDNGANARFATFPPIAAGCAGSPEVSAYFPAGHEPIALALDGDQIFSVGAQTVDPSHQYIYQATIWRTNRTTLEGEARWQRSGQFDGSGFFDGVVVGGELWAVGQRDGNLAGQNAKGWLVTLPLSFDEGTDPTRDVLFTDVRRIQAIVPDDDGFYLAGRQEILGNLAGFVARCALPFDCPLTTR